jgi:hypothetical protein
MDFDELVYGDKGAPKMRRLKKGLQEIENNHLEYFEERTSPLSFEENDRLHNHYNITSNPHGVYFAIKPESDLPEEIKVKCQNLFNEIFDIN